MQFGLGLALSRPKGRAISLGIIPGGISDLSAGYVNPDDPEGPLLESASTFSDPIILRWTPATNEVDAEAQFRVVDGEWGESIDIDLLSEVHTTLEDSQPYEARVRAISVDGRPGAWSNTDTFYMHTPGWVLRDSNSISILGTEVAPGNLNLDAMGAAANEVLDRQIGDRVIIFGSSAHSAGSIKQVTRGAATGWSERAFSNDAQTIAQTGCRVLDKICDGSEGIVDVFDNAASTTNAARVNYIVLALRPIGNSDFVTAGAATTQSNPPQQSLAVGAEGPGVFVWAIHAAGTSANVNPLLTGTGFTPSIDILVGSDTTFASHLRLHAHIFPIGTAPVDLLTNPADAGNNAHAWGYHKALVP